MAKKKIKSDSEQPVEAESVKSSKNEDLRTPIFNMEVPHRLNEQGQCPHCHTPGKSNIMVTLWQNVDSDIICSVCGDVYYSLMNPNYNLRGFFKGNNFEILPKETHYIQPPDLKEQQNND